MINSENTNAPIEPSRHKRRIRYHGTHPRRFADKYKELNPDSYTQDIEKVLARGQTPAGMHRPICVTEILSILAPCPGEIFLDATLGYGGHTQEIVKKLLPGGKLFALDVDPIELPRTESRLRKAGFTPENLIIRKMNFAGISALLNESGGGFDGVLADLGVSSMQLDSPARGFSYKLDGPLDLRLNPQHTISAVHLIETLPEKALTKLLIENGDEPQAEKICAAIKKSSRKITTTKALAELIQNALQSTVKDPTEIKKSIQRTFMALRIAVNDEFGVLERFLNLLPWCLKPGGRVAILTFHSGEDRRVKKAFKMGLTEGLYTSIAPTPLRPSAAEQAGNPRSSCAKLRWAIRSDMLLTEC